MGNRLYQRHFWQAQDKLAVLELVAMASARCRVLAMCRTLGSVGVGHRMMAAMVLLRFLDVTTNRARRPHREGDHQ